VHDSSAGPVRNRRSNRAVVYLGVAAAMAGVAAALILSGHRSAAGVAGMGGAGGLILGTMHTRAGVVSRRLFARNIVEEVHGACLLGPLAWVSRSTAPRVSALALVALSAAFAASYERAKAAALGYRTRDGGGYVAARAALPAFGLLTGLVESSLWALASLALAAVVVRAWNVAAQNRRSAMVVSAETPHER
jgi:hypothetical protein